MNSIPTIEQETDLVWVTALLLKCMREVSDTEERFAKEAQENDAYTGGPIFLRTPRRCSEAEVREIIRRRFLSKEDQPTMYEHLQFLQVIKGMK